MTRLRKTLNIPNGPKLQVICMMSMHLIYILKALCSLTALTSALSATYIHKIECFTYIQKIFNSMYGPIFPGGYFGCGSTFFFNSWEWCKVVVQI